MNGQAHYGDSNCKVLFIASLAALPRVWRMASTLARCGFLVTILEWDRSGDLPPFETRRRINVCRMTREAPEGIGMVSKLPLWWLCISRFLISHRFDVIQPQNLDNLIPALVFSHLNRAKIVYDVADFWETGYVPPSMTYIGRTFRWLEQALVRVVDGLILVSEGQIAQIGIRNIPQHSIILYNTVSSDELDSVYSSSKKDEIRLLFAGTLGRDRVYPLLNLAIALQDSKRVRLVIAGFGEMEQFASKTFSNMGNVRYLGFLPHEEVINQTANCDCVVIPYDSRLFNNKIGLASKFFEALALSKALVVQEGIAMAELVRENQCGFVTDFLDKRRIIETIREIEDGGHRLLTIMGVGAKQLYLRKYAWPLMEERLLGLYSLIINGSQKT